MKPARIAALRPELPPETLATLLGRHAAAADENGYIPGTLNRGFRLRVRQDGAAGSVRFFKPLDAQVLVEGLHVGMSCAQAIATQPLLEPLPPRDIDPEGHSRCQMHTADGHELEVTFANDKILALQISQPDAVYPEPPKLLADPDLTCAYDLLREPQRLQPESDRGDEWAAGWSLGLPPGISQAQWPMSSRLGHPLRHAFTLHLPAQYRTQGEQYVAISVFVDDQFEELESTPRVQEFFKAPLSAEPPTDPTLLALWQHRQARHPRQFDMDDILGTQFSLLWLTQSEFDGALCTPPRMPETLQLGPEPAWLRQTYADYFYTVRIRNPNQPPYAWLEGSGLETAFPIRIELREGDPNVGKPPREWESECVDSGYIPAYSDQGQALGLERFFGRNHLGGTMFAEQSYPDFGPRFLGCEEDFGGFNLGGGSAQFDLERMEMDWACG